MRRPPYSSRVMKGIYFIWRKTKVNIENGYVPHWWTAQNRKDVDRAIKWLGDFFDWVEWKQDEAEKVKKAREADPPVIEEEGEDV